MYSIALILNNLNFYEYQLQTQPQFYSKTCPIIIAHN